MAARSAISRLSEGKNRIAVLMSGCGVYDGSEIQESVYLLTRLSKKRADVSHFAPDRAQMHVVNHLTGEPDDKATARNALQEAARITRGKNTFPLEKLIEKGVDNFDALMLPGGFGAAKNLSDFGPVGGPGFTVDPEVEKIVKAFHNAGKPIGLVCIAPMIAGKVFENMGIKMTMGAEEEMDGRWPFAGATGAAKALGCNHIVTDIVDKNDKGMAVVDDKNKIVTAAAYMCGTADMWEIEESVSAMVDKTCELIE